MLIFTRRAGQRIRIGDDIEIAILEVKKGNIKIGISAPKGLPIHREEVYQKILEANRLAAESSLNETLDFDDLTLEKDTARK